VSEFFLWALPIVHYEVWFCFGGFSFVLIWRYKSFDVKKGLRINLTKKKDFLDKDVGEGEACRI
jgi:hypothetical protein